MDKRNVSVDDDLSDGHVKKSLRRSNQTSSGIYQYSGCQVNYDHFANSMKSENAVSQPQDLDETPEGEYRPCLFTLLSKNGSREFKLYIGSYNKQRVLKFECKNYSKGTTYRDTFECPRDGLSVKENTWLSLVFTYSSKNNVRYLSYFSLTEI